MLLFLEGPALDFSSIITALTGAVTASDVIGYMASICTAGIGIYLAYVFGRKAIRAFSRAIKGKAPTV